MTGTTAGPIAGLAVGLALAMPAAAGAVVIEVAAFEEGEVELSTFDAPVGEGALSLAVGYEGGNPSTAEGGFEVLVGDELALDGELATLAAPGGGTLELAFGDLGGSAAGAYRGAALVTLDFGDALGADPLAAFEDGGAYEAAIELASASDGSPAPIPLPASGALMLAAAAGLAALRRRA